MTRLWQTEDAKGDMSFLIQRNDNGRLALVTLGQTGSGRAVELDNVAVIRLYEALAQHMGLMSS